METEPFDLRRAFSNLPAKTKPPVSARVLETWIQQAETKIGSTRGRLGWLIAATVVTAALQQAVDMQGEPLFLLKGGTLLQFRIGGSRATSDLDGLVRGSIDEFLDLLDDALRGPWGPFTLRRSEAETITVPGKAIMPRRFDVVVQLSGATWRRIQVELSPEEGSAGAAYEAIKPPSLAPVGLPTPDRLVGLAMAYQIAQKIHASTDPHDPPAALNDRARDVVDLVLLRDLVETTGKPTLIEVRTAVLDVFAARAAEAKMVGLNPRAWPTALVAHPHWRGDYTVAASATGVTLSLDDAVAGLNVWFAAMENA